MTDSIPSSPQGWSAWANSAAVSKIPATKSSEHTSANTFVHDVFVDLALLDLAQSDFTNVYTDILALSSEATMKLPLPELALASLYARVITSDQPTTLELSPSSREAAQIVLWATYLDKPVSVALEGQQPQLLDLGPDSGHVGVSIVVKNGDISLTYLPKYMTPDLDANGHLAKLLASQLRIASTLFWTQPAVASAIAWHVVRATAQSYDSAALNVQASALQQQISASQLAGPGLTYAPVLKLEYYKNTIAPVLDAGAAFQQQYDRFTDKEATLDDQLQAWDTMVKQAEGALVMQQQLAEDAKAKWDASQQILRAAQNDMRSHQLTLEDRAAEFRAGIEVWKVHQIVKAVVDILKAVVTFALAIGAMCVGDPGPAAGAPAEAAEAVKEVAAAAEAAGEVTKVISKKTLESLEKLIEMLSSLLETTISNVNSIISATSGDGTLSPFPASEKGNEDLEELAGVAAWDKWTLDIEDQMQFAVSEAIGGASAYLVELKKHAIDGKLVTQATAQTVKAGQEFVQLQLSLKLAQADLSRLQELRESFQGEKDQYETARLYFYDRLDSMRTSVLIELRNLVWAFKFYTLTDSKVVLDPLKDVEDYKADLALLVQEVEKWEEGFASDKSPIHFIRGINDPCFNGIGSGVIASLKEAYNATFALAPSPSTIPSGTYNAGPFTDGSSFRVFGLRAFLVGIVPKPEALSQDGTALVWMTIRTSGAYQDIRGDNTVLGFTSMPQERQFKYRVDASGQAIPEPDGIEVDSIIPMGNHMDPPPFTQWSITLNQPDLMDLAGLQDLKLEWKGEAYL
ncbi:hypothetical protein EV715DRAFT_197400 [Schizophyllum commune]